MGDPTQRHTSRVKQGRKVVLKNDVISGQGKGGVELQREKASFGVFESCDPTAPEGQVGVLQVSRMLQL